MGQIFDEELDASKSYYFLDKIQEPYRITLCPRQAGELQFKRVAFRGAGSIGFVIEGNPNPPFSISANTTDLLGMTSSSLTLSYIRPVDAILEWKVKAKKIVGQGGKGPPQFEPGDLDTLTVVALPPLKLNVNIRVVRSKAEPPWTNVKREDFEFLLSEASRILQTQLNVTLQLGDLLEYFDENIHNGVLPRYRVNDSMDTGPLTYHRTGINWDGDNIGCYAMSTPLLDGCKPDETRFVKDMKTRQTIEGHNFRSALMLERNTADFDVFFVSQLLLDKEDADVAAFNLGSTRKCVIQKKVKPSVLAHEIGHWIFRRYPGNVKNHSPDTDNLMYKDEGSKRLNMEQIYYGHFEVSNFLKYGWRFG